MFHDRIGIKNKSVARTSLLKLVNIFSSEFNLWKTKKKNVKAKVKLDSASMPIIKLRKKILLNSSYLQIRK